jgi:hypothetical protein
MNHLKEVRGDITQPMIVRRLGMPEVYVTTVSVWEQGKSNPTPQQMPAVCAAYGAPLEKLYDPEDLDYGYKSPHKADKRAGDEAIRKVTIRLTPADNLRLISQMGRLRIHTQADLLRYYMDQEDKREARNQRRRQKKTAQLLTVAEQSQGMGKVYPDNTPGIGGCQDGTDNDGRRTATV